MQYKHRQAQRIVGCLQGHNQLISPYMVMPYLCRPPYLDIVYLLLCVKPMKFKLEQSSATLLRFKSLFIDKSLRQAVFDLCSSEIKLSYKHKIIFSLFEIKKDNLHLQVSSRCNVFVWCQEMWIHFTEYSCKLPTSWRSRQWVLADFL